MNAWFPALNALWTAENIVGSLHGALTLRGAPVRDARGRRVRQR
jgi:alkyl sulfatase BDS1-like metallo-beta-lactamase superfamily hydrolase